MPGTEVGGSGRAGKGGEGEANEEGEEGEEEEGAGGEEEEEGEGEDVEMGEEEGDEAGAAWEGEAGGEDGAAGLTDDLSGQENADQAQQQEDDGDMVGGLDEGRLFVRNLPYLATEPELRSLFGGYGRVDEILLPMDNETRRAKGYAHVTFSICEDAVRALAGLDGAIFQGRLMHVLPGKPRARMTGNGAGNGAGGWVGGEGDKGTSSFKRKREEEQKASAGSSHNWNPLFMRSDAVGEAMAERYGMDKREILDTEGGASLAVRLAQGETHLLAQTREWLATSGISVEALARLSRTDNKTSSDDKTSVERSATLLLVKNIDGKVSQRELSKLFGKYGQVASVLLAPGNALALVEFVEVGEAKRAFRSVAYSKLYGVPLFLEWAPVGLLDTAPAAKAAAKAAAAGAAASGRTGGVGGGAGNDTAAGEAEAAGEAKPEEEEEEGGEGRTLFVKNLNFKTTSEGLRALFTVNGWGVRSASVVTKRDPKQPDRMLSMGYGFVEFNTAAHAHDALRRMAGARIDEHRVQLKMSSRGTADGGAEARPARPAPAGGAAKASNKLLVRNVPFEASKAELRDLFSAFGQLKTLRIPKKFDGSHRGFAFVEFVSKAEAAKAMASLDGTHLYGRHLVLGYAKKEDTVEAMREKLRAQMGAAGGGKRQKKGGEGEEGGEEDPEALLDFDL
jgi:multiple RNA-binding domain-containing protein 1